MAASPQSDAPLEAGVIIDRPVEEVFAFYRDFGNLPAFLGDVMRVEPIDERTSRWTIQGPLGLDVRWTVAIIEIRPNTFIAYQTESAIARVRWEVSFTPGSTAGATMVREVMLAPGGRFAQAALAAVGKPPADEMRANLQRLKEVLETGRVTTMDHAVAGKFSA